MHSKDFSRETRGECNAWTQRMHILEYHLIDNSVGQAYSPQAQSSGRLLFSLVSRSSGLVALAGAAPPEALRGSSLFKYVVPIDPTYRLRKRLGTPPDALNTFSLFLNTSSKIRIKITLNTKYFSNFFNFAFYRIK